MIATGKLTERMNIDQARESIENMLEFLTESFLGVLDLSGVEAWWEISSAIVLYR